MSFFLMDQRAKDPGGPIIRTRGASKTFGSGRLAFTALYPTDFEVGAGELVMIVGPSGSGKTTLLSIIGCVLDASTGEVVVGGDDVVGRGIDELADLRRKNLGFVFQQHNLLASLTAVENVEVPLVLEGVGGRGRRRLAAEALGRVGLEDKLHAKPRELSGGQMQRVAIARALVTEPRVLLCDEPTAALDSKTGHTVIELLRDLAHEHSRSVVIVTHDPRIFSYADRIVRIEDGRIVEAGGQP